MLIYLGDNWPAEYRGRLFTINMHGRRANQEILERNGSGYVGRHGPDFFLAGDPWFRGMELSYGPDGGVFVLDWSDTGECHESTGVHRTSGRVYKITYGLPRLGGVGDLAKHGTGELVKLHTHPNEWFTRQARLELAARAARQTSIWRKRSCEMFEQDDLIKLRALVSPCSARLNLIGFSQPPVRHPNEHVRAWAVRLLTDTWPLDTVLSQPRINSEGSIRTIG